LERMRRFLGIVVGHAEVEIYSRGVHAYRVQESRNRSVQFACFTVFLLDGGGVSTLFLTSSVIIED
jgi:hypothetical protein